jgi:sugar phosphate isomerase/epimerase
MDIIKAVQYPYMQIGFPNNPRKDILSEVEWIGKNKFDFVDFFLEEDRAVPGKIPVAKVKALLKKYELGAVGHTAWYLDYASPIKAQRDAAIEETARYLRVFKRLGVRKVTMHGNWPMGMFSEKEGIALQVRSLKRIVAEGKRLGITIMYEHVPTEWNHIGAVEKVLDSVPGLMFHLDVGHASLLGQTPGHFIERFHKKLIHVHLHDNRLIHDDHLPLGAGKVKWKHIVRELSKVYDGTITLEIFVKDKKKVLESKRKLERFLGP